MYEARSNPFSICFIVETQFLQDWNLQHNTDPDFSDRITKFEKIHLKVLLLPLPHQFHLFRLVSNSQCPDAMKIAVLYANGTEKTMQDYFDHCTSPHHPIA